MLSQAFAQAVNHVMRQEGWPLDHLKPLAGRSARFSLMPLDLTLTIAETGELAAAAADAVPDATFALTPPLALRIVAGDEEAYGEVRVEGDTDLAEALLFVAKHLRWDAEEDLSRVLGDVAARRVARTGRDLLRWQSEAALNLARAFSEYWTEEQPLIARAADVSGFVSEVDRLRNDVERLEKRIAKIQSRRDAESPK